MRKIHVHACRTRMPKENEGNLLSYREHNSSRRTGFRDQHTGIGVQKFAHRRHRQRKIRLETFDLSLSYAYIFNFFQFFFLSLSLSLSLALFFFNIYKNESRAVFSKIWNRPQRCNVCNMCVTCVRVCTCVYVCVRVRVYACIRVSRCVSRGSRGASKKFRELELKLDVPFQTLNDVYPKVL